MKDKDAEELLRKYRSGTCSEEERALLEQWYQEWDTGEPSPDPEELKAMREQTWHDLEISQKKSEGISFLVQKHRGRSRPGYSLRQRMAVFEE